MINSWDDEQVCPLTEGLTLSMTDNKTMSIFKIDKMITDE